MGEAESVNSLLACLSRIEFESGGRGLSSAGGDKEEFQIFTEIK